MIEPVSRTKDPKLFIAVLLAVVGDQLFGNVMLVEDSSQMIDNSAIADVSQCSHGRKLAVEV